MIANILSIAGSDPSGGAGIQADLKTFAAMGCHGMAALTALTAQNTQGVSAVHVPPADFLTAQLDAIFADIRVDAVKIGMLATGEIVQAVARSLARHGAKNIVLDPVLVATSGDSLGAPDVVAALLEHLMPLASVITPNLPEAARLTGQPLPGSLAEMISAGEKLVALGAKAVLVKGGHLGDDSRLGDATARDVLVTATRHRVYEAPRVATKNTHGTGCTLSSAIAAALAQGDGMEVAVERGKVFLTGALKASGVLSVGKGHGPVWHFWMK